MSYRGPTRSVTGGLSGAIVLIGLVLAFAFGGFNLVIFFIALAFAVFVGSLGSRNPRGAYGGLIGAIWMIMLALFFATGSWLWFLVGAALSAILGTLVGPITALLLNLGIFGLTSTTQSPQMQQPYYSPPPQQAPYQQGYQPPQPEGYQEGGQRYQYPGQQQPSQQQYEQPQSQYPQEMPPQQ